MAHRISALFTDPHRAEQAVGSLMRNGFDRSQVEVLSSEPLLDLKLPTSGHEEKTRMTGAAMFGGLVGAVAGFSLAAATFTWMSLPTGGMPIIPLGPSGLITFEVTALGAIFGTVLTLLVEGRLPRTITGTELALFEAVADGSVLVSVHCTTQAQALSASSVLQDAGAEKVDP
jgi:hypothetical protein